MDYSKFVTKREKSLKIALVLAIILMVIGYLVFSNDDESISVEDDSGAETNNYKWGFFALGAIILYLIFGNGNKSLPVKTDEEIINFVADEIFEDKGIYLNTSLNNVRVQKGGVDETYVEFLDKHLAFLYLENVGITERYPGESIKQIKKAKHGDIIEMEMAKGRVAKKKFVDLHNARLEAYDLTEEEQ